MNSQKKSRTITTAEAQLADRVRLPGGPPWDIAIVKRITPDEIVLFRPYATTGGFEYTGGVICLIGVEEFALPRDAKHELKLVHQERLDVHSSAQVQEGARKSVKRAPRAPKAAEESAS